MGEAQAVVIHIELERAAVGEEGGGQEIKIGEEEFAFVKFGAGEEPAAIVQPIEPGQGLAATGEPAVGRGVELPAFAELGALPAADGGADVFGRDGVGQFIVDGPPADLGTVEFEVVEAEGFGGGEAVGTRRGAGEPFAEQCQHRWWPGLGVIAAGSARRPERFYFLGAGGVVSGGEGIAPTAGQAELFGGLCGCPCALPKSFEHMADESGRVALVELLILFTRAAYPIAAPNQKVSCFAISQTCPALLAPRQIFVSEMPRRKYQRGNCFPPPITKNNSCRK